MEVPSLEVRSNNRADSCPLLMDRLESLNRSEHVIDITRNDDASSSSSTHDRPPGIEASPSENRPSSTIRVPLTSEHIVNESNSRNAMGRRGEARRRRSPLNSVLWISVELFLTTSQIIAAIVVLSLSGHEYPRSPLFAWIVGYASGCVATLPLLYWRYRHRNQTPEQDLTQSRQSSQLNLPAGPFSVSVSRPSEGESQRNAIASPRSGLSTGLTSARVKVLVEYLKMALDCFFAVWFVVGNVWVFGGHSSASEAPNLYRLCIVFLAISCIGYAMPFILCATICCCLPCIISILGFREELTQSKGATPDSINALPTYKFKLKKTRSSDNVGATEGGILAAGTAKERLISGEDAVCCICLAKYSNNDELRELPCSHVFHKECVDKWLKINALCPLCKSDVGESVSGENGSSEQRGNRIGNGLAVPVF